MPCLFLVTKQHAQGPDKLSGVFLSEPAAKAFIVPGIFAHTFEELVANGGVVEVSLPEKEFRKVEKTGVVYIACESGQTRAGYAIPAHASPSKSGLVKKAAAAGDYYRTEFQLFEDTPLAGSYLVEGYPMPPGHQKYHFCSGPLICKALAAM